MQLSELNLKDRVLAYQRTGRGLEDLIRDLALVAYDYPTRKGRWNDDEPGEFLLSFLPRIQRLLDRYRDAGVPCEHYFASALSWSLRAYRRDARRRDRDWGDARSRDFWEESPSAAPEVASRAAPLLVLGPVDARGRLQRATDRRRLLLILMRDAWYLDAEQIVAGARALDVEQAELQQMVGRIRDVVADRLDRLERLRRRRDTAFARLLRARQALANESDPERRQALRRDANDARESWRRAIGAMSRVRLAPTHRELARELAMPRGTVTTSLRWVRLHAAELLQSAEKIRYA